MTSRRMLVHFMGRCSSVPQALGIYLNIVRNLDTFTSERYLLPVQLDNHLKNRSLQYTNAPQRTHAQDSIAREVQNFVDLKDQARFHYKSPCRKPEFGYYGFLWMPLAAVPLET